MRGAVGMVLVLAGSAWAAGGCAPVANGGGEADMPDLLPSVQATSANDSIEFVLQVTNTTDEPVPVSFSSGQTYDFVVYDASGAEVWRWSDERMFTQALREESVAPGETLTYSAIWVPAPGLSGPFEVLGVLTARDREIGQRTEFRVP